MTLLTVGDIVSLIVLCVLCRTTGPNKVKVVSCFQVVVLSESNQQIRGRVVDSSSEEFASFPLAW
jgi:hypothetical protein